MCKTRKKQKVFRNKGKFKVSRNRKKTKAPEIVQTTVKKCKKIGKIQHILNEYTVLHEYIVFSNYLEYLVQPRIYICK